MYSPMQCLNSYMKKVMCNNDLLSRRLLYRHKCRIVSGGLIMIETTDNMLH